MKIKYFLSIVFLLLSTGIATAQNSLYPETPAWRILNSAHFSGVIKTSEGISFSLPGKAVYTEPEVGKGWYQRGLMGEYDGVIDARRWYGFKLDIELENDQLFEADFVIKIPDQQGRHNLPDSSTAIIKLQGKGWHTVVVPFNSFDYNRGQVNFLKYIKQISVTGKYANGTGTKLQLRHIKLIKGNPIKLEADIRSKPGEADSMVTYDATISNSSDEVQYISLNLIRSGWEGLKATVEPAFITLQPGDIKPITLRVMVPSFAPQGARETQLLTASTGTGVAAASIEFITLRKLEGPYLIHQEAGWQAVLDKTRKYTWAKESMLDYIRRADDFIVPELKPDGMDSDGGSRAVFQSYLEQHFWPVAVAYKLTGDKKYAQKLALLLNRLANPAIGYPARLHANSQGIPQEGGFWEGVARSYDLIKDAGVLTAQEKTSIEHSIRLFILTIQDGMGDGGISNWSVYNLCPAAQCALVIQDMQLFNYIMDGPGGVKEHLRYGMMDDGWWYEMSLSYNLGCAENMTSLGLAALPFGIDFLHENIPVSITQKVGLRPFEFENFQGMAFGKFGPVKQNYITLKRMWDNITAFPDYRGVMFGMGDGHEHEAGGPDFDKAYFAYRDTAYAAVIKQGSKRDLLYGIPQLPENTPKLYAQSVHSDNAGIALLRSQTVGRELKDQIQVALKYGTHGGYHGHFDRISLLSLMRYGRSFWNPETSWFGYGSYMYKWWVQPSMAHNMVVVDGKQQEPVESKLLLFHTGKMMQAAMAEDNARWSNPPYFGGYDQIARVKAADAPYVPVPAKHPDVAAVTDYSEPVLQRRLLIVTDDYVVTADYLKAGKSHTFDNLLHLRGAKADPGLKPIGKAQQFDNSPLSSGQFITNVTDYAVKGTAKVLSTMIARAGNDWESGGFNGYQEPGLLNIDVYNAWPLNTTLRVGNYPEGYNIGKKMIYQVEGDRQVLAKDSVGTWLLGRADVDLNIKGIKTLTLKITKSKGNQRNTLFWGGAKLITSGGKEIPLSGLKLIAANTIPTNAADKDYYGGLITISGKKYDDALAAEPLDAAQPSVITIDLTGLDAVRFVAGVGGDAPVGDDDQVRKTVSFRTTGKEARFLTVLEPYENKQMVKAVKAIDSNNLIVLLADGRTQKIKLKNFDGTGDQVQVTITETKDGKEVNTETAIYGH